MAQNATPRETIKTLKGLGDNDCVRVQYVNSRPIVVLARHLRAVFELMQESPSVRSERGYLIIAWTMVSGTRNNRQVGSMTFRLKEQSAARVYDLNSREWVTL